MSGAIFIHMILLLDKTLQRSLLPEQIIGENFLRKIWNGWLCSIFTETRMHTVLLAFDKGAHGPCGIPKLRDLMQKEELSLLQLENASPGIDRSLWQYFTHLSCTFSYELVKS